MRKYPIYNNNLEGFMLNEIMCVCVWLSLYDPMDYSLPGSVHGILQVRTLEWIAIPFSRGSSRPRDWTHISCIAGRFFTIWATRECSDHKLFPHLDLRWLRCEFSVFMCWTSTESHMAHGARKLKKFLKKIPENTSYWVFCSNHKVTCFFLACL